MNLLPVIIYFKISRYNKNMMRWFLKTWRDNESSSRLLYLCERQNIPIQTGERRRKRIKKFATWEDFLSSLLLLIFWTLDRLITKLCAVWWIIIFEILLREEQVFASSEFCSWLVRMFENDETKYCFERVWSVLSRHDIANNLLCHQ